MEDLNNKKYLKKVEPLIERSHSIVVQWKNTPNWPIEHISNNVETILGYTTDEFLTGAVLYANIIHPNDLDRVKKEAKSFEKNDIKNYKHKPYRLICKNGIIKWFKDDTKAIINKAGKIISYDGVLTDISDAILAKEEILKEKEKINSILSSFQDGVYISDNNFNISELNERMKKIIGNNAVGEKCYHAIFGNSEPCFWCYYNDLKRGKSILFEKDLHKKTYLIRAILLEDNAKMTIYHDISDFKSLENELKSKNKKLQKLNKQITLEKERFKNIVENTGEWIWEIDTKGNFIYSNSLVKNISGFSSKEIITKNILHIVDKKHKENLTKILQKKIAQHQGWRNTEIKFTHKNGSIRYVESNSVPILNEKGVIKGFRGVNQDITKRKLEEKEKEKLLTAVEQSPNAIIITDLESNIEYINPTFENYYGYTLKEVKGKNPKILKSGHHSNSFYADLHKTINSGKIWKGEILNKTKKGNLIWVSVTISPMVNSFGKVVNYIGVQQDITKQKEIDTQLEKTLQKLKEKEAFLNNIFQTAAEGFWIINNEAITLIVNSKMCEILDFKESEIIGKSIYDFVDGENNKIFKEQLKLRDLGKSSSYEIDLTNKKGENIPCLFSTSPIFDNDKTRIGSFAFVTNISGLKKAHIILEEKNKKLNALTFELSEKNRLLFESKKRYQDLFEQNPISLWEEDFTEVKKLLQKKIKEGVDIATYINKHPKFVENCLNTVKLINTNNATLKLIGEKSKKSLFEKLGHNFTEKSIDTFKEELIAIALNKKEFSAETEFLRSDGAPINAILKIVLIENDRAIVSVNDITEIKKAKEKLNKQYEELVITKEKAEESNRLKTEFLNNMSHEIRTPMNGILGFTDLLTNNDISPEKRNNFIQIILNSGNQLLHIIDDILEISKLGTKQVIAIDSEICINTLLVELFSAFEIKSKDTGIPLYLKKALSDSESTVFTDALKLNKILGNLLENAYKFTNTGFIEFGYKLVNNWFQFYVKDTGIGVNPEKQEAIFERFSQEEKELSKKFGGLGLGLSIAKENAQLLGGNISLTSEKGVGSTFTVNIPYKPVYETDNSNATTNTINKKTKTMILITEDEQTNFIFLETLLLDVLNLDYTLHHAKNGQEAVDFCLANSNIDLILMDLKMPVMNGFEATKIIKDKFPKIPIIAQTAYSTDEDQKRAFDAGCNDFLSKPISKENLTLILSKHITV